jgi:amidohydrolase
MSNLEKGREAIAAYLDEHDAEMRECSLDLYKNPELSGEEVRSCKKLADIAEEDGFVTERNSGGLPTAFRSDKKGTAGGDGPTVSFLAEYDALPEIGHGCGHNFIGTASTYAALALGAASDHYAGTVALIGTPSEETDGGKIDMLNEGVFKDVDLAMMVHPSSETDAYTVSLALVPVRVRFHGKPAHAAAEPWEGLNALDAMIQFFVGLDHMKKQFPPHIRIPGVITKGGVRSNMVPDLTEAEFSVRTTQRGELERLWKRFLEVGEGVAKTTGCRFEYEEFGNRYYEMLTNNPLAERFHEEFKAVGGDLVPPQSKLFGSIDIGNLSHEFPCIHPRIKTCGLDVAGHTVAFGDATITEGGMKQLRRSAETMARTALDYLLDENFRQEVKRDFEQAKAHAKAS